MIQANLLLPLGGRTADSFGVMDLMRLPLGILTGVGFIGGAAILRRGNLVAGVTTAATLWVMTVIGLCLGGGQLILGVTTAVLTVITLWLLKWIDNLVPRLLRAKLAIMASRNEAAPASPCEALEALGYRAHFRAQEWDADGLHRTTWFDILWMQPTKAGGPPLDLLQTLKKRFAVRSREIVGEDAHWREDIAQGR
jgi:putative Mg2+ transporter-C (MgtC) family protein